MRKLSRRMRILLILLFAAVILYGVNASRFAPEPGATRLRFIAHRGVHQNFDHAGLDNDACTATRIAPPTHGFLENTIPSMRAAFDAGADVVELDVHPTTDGQFVVFHDWTVDCRTNGKGVTREHSLAGMKALDVGYGYTADGGATFPFRGKGVGMAPSLDEVFAAFPERQFLINFKGRDTREGDMLAARPQWRTSIFGVYGGGEPVSRALQLVSGLKGYDKKSVKDCVFKYIAFGWSGWVPQSCHNSFVPVPINVAPYLWGWPNRFLARMKAAGSEVILLGPYSSGEPGALGIDGPELLAAVPQSFDGWVWTNRMESLGALKFRRTQ